MSFFSVFQKKNTSLTSIEEKLFQTNSMKIACENTAYWYTSGKIGPFFINTHYLYGNQTEADRLLELIDKNKKEPDQLIALLNKEILDFYQSNTQYKAIIDNFYN